ncbi:hypothetical protein [Streptomyces sp. NBC_01483]|uniref:hypothetical protein n=1 Tax=Streptomyces sp. NBC_01483 TaxID=2903883 RepID=UPI002E3471E5|nr:hypothetical protein [Streptomyces sp. NBC_01483]
MIETAGEQARGSATAGPAAVRDVAAAGPAVTVASTDLRRMPVTAGRLGDAREAAS